MVEALQNREAESFVCAAGVLAHYVGDACQPLHVSRFHHGHPGHPEERDVHSFYETKMLDQFAPDVVAKVNDALGERIAASSFQGGAAAAERVVRLMRETINRLSPETVVNTWLETAGNHHTRDLWNALGEDTAALMAEGVLCLADIWESAWIEGDGDHRIEAASLDRALDHRVLQRLYNDRSFVESKWLKNMSF